MTTAASETESKSFSYRKTAVVGFGFLDISVFWPFVNVNSLPLVYDHGDEQRIGAFTGLYYFSSQSAAVLGPTLGGVMVDTLGDQYRWLFVFSAIFMALAFVAISRVR